jgi:hypothetical protein
MRQREVMAHDMALVFEEAVETVKMYPGVKRKKT